MKGAKTRKLIKELNDKKYYLNQTMKLGNLFWAENFKFTRGSIIVQLTSSLTSLDTVA